LGLVNQTSTGRSDHGLRALVVDWGGVLTGGVDDAFRAWAARDGVAGENLAAVLQEAFSGEGSSPVHALERGELTGPQFEQLMATELAARGSTVQAEGLLSRMLGGLSPSESMLGLVAAVRAAGLRTAVLSNSWANDYPSEGWDSLFDVVVISGEVGMRKPEPRIYHHVLDLIDVRPEQAVFVDDLPVNVSAAAGVGMVGVLHRSFEQTAAELEVLLGLPLTPEPARPEPV
jgi:putative hydrolase of the HAD superfamily